MSVCSACVGCVVMCVLGVLGAGVVGGQSEQHLCGEQLSDALSMVCHGRGFHVQKKSVDMGGVPRGVADECCKKKCNLQQLESYCAPGPSAIKIGSLLWPTRSPATESPFRPHQPLLQPKSPNSRISIGQGPALPASYFWVTPARRDPFMRFIHKQRDGRSVPVWRLDSSSSTPQS